MIVKRSLSIRGHRTSISLEDAFWQELRGMAERRGISLARLVSDIDATRGVAENLSSSLRVAVLRHALSKGEPQQDEPVESTG